MIAVSLYNNATLLFTYKKVFYNRFFIYRNIRDHELSSAQ
jgi:hypothetical protein